MDAGTGDQSTSAADEFDWGGGEGAAKARSNFVAGDSADQAYIVESDSDDDFDQLDSARKKLRT